MGRRVTSMALLVALCALALWAGSMIPRGAASPAALVVGAPVLVSPADGRVVSSARPSLSWNAVAGANAYRVEIDDDPDFLTNNPNPSIRTIEHTSSALQATSYAVPTTLDHGAHYWRVQARDASGWGPFSPPSRFIVHIATSPADGAFNTKGQPRFQWTITMATRGYRVQVATDPSFAVLVRDIEVPGRFSYRFRLLGENTLAPGTYYWRVLTNRDNPQVPPVAGGYRALFVGSVPAPPALASPPESALVGPQPTLEWAPVLPDQGIAVARYEVEVAANSAFTSGVQRFATTSPVNSLTVPAPLASGTWHWRVRAILGQSSPGVWSVSRAFVVGQPAQGPSPLLPEAGSSTTETQPRFTWSPVQGAAHYEIRLGTATPLSVSYTESDTDFVPPGPLLYRTYYWQVRSVDSAGNPSNWSPVQSVTIVSADDAAPMLYRSGGPSMTMTWSRIAWAAGGFEVWVDDDPDFGSPNQRIRVPQGQQYAATSALPEGTYYWRVRALDGGGNPGIWSSTGRFTVES